MIKWKNYNRVVNFFIENNEVFPNVIKFLYSFKHLKNEIDENGIQLIYLKPLIIETYNSIIKEKGKVVIDKLKFENVLIEKIKRISNEKSKKHFILLIPNLLNKKWKTRHFKLLNWALYQNDWIPDLNDFFKKCKENNFVANFNLLIQNLLKKHFNKLATYFCFCFSNKKFCTSLFESNKEDLFFDLNEINLETVTDLILDENSSINLITTYLPYQMILYLARYDGRQKYDVKVFNKYRNGISLSTKCHLPEYFPYYFSIDLGSLIKIIEKWFVKLKFPVENFTTALCLTGLNNCFNVIALDVAKWLKLCCNTFVDGKPIVLKDEIEGVFTFDYNLTSELLLQCCKSSKKGIKSVLIDYEKFLNEDLQI